jgi:hypothetical protein
MKVGVFTPEEADRHHDTVLKAFANGVKETGDECFVDTVDRYKPCDVAVVFGVFKKAVALSRHRGTIIDLHKTLKKPVVVIDSGYVKRDEYFAVGLNGLNGRANFKNAMSRPDRWASLGVNLTPWREDGGHVLICGQIPWDASVQDTDHIKWCRETVSGVRERTSRKIVFRPHPKCAAKVDYGVNADVVSTAPLADDLENAHCVVTFSSNTGVDAAIAGVPVFADDHGSMAWPVANKSFAWIDSPIRPTREQWAANLAYTQWTIDEMKEGKPWRHLMH